LRIEDEQRFAGHLLRGERLLWVGQPKQGLLLLELDLFLIFYGLFGALVVVSLSVGLAREPSIAAVLIASPFLAPGLFLAGGHFVVDAWLRRRTYYAVTDRRILFLREAPFASFTFLDRASLPLVELDAYKEDGAQRGTIRFGPKKPFKNWSQMLPALEPVPRFLAIADAQAVFDLIQRSRPSTAA